MGEYFRGWKRKLGVLTLAMACVLTTGWVRSDATQDHFQIKVTDRVTYRIVSSRATLVWQGIHWLEPEQSLRRFDMWKIPTGSSTALSDDYLHDVSFRLISPDADFPGMTLRAWLSPYWAIVLPLTLISAWLLLSKPRGCPKGLTGDGQSAE